jgi:hypothetical protein
MAIFVSYCFGVLGDLHGPWHIVHVWEAWPKTHRFCVLGPFTWVIAHYFGFMRWFTRAMTLNVWEVWPKTHRFYVLGYFMSYCRHFGVLGWFWRPMTLSTCLTGMTKNSSFLYLWPFLWAIAHCFGVMGMGDLHGPWHSVHVWEAWPKTCHFYVIGPFSWASAHSFGFPGWFTRSMTLSTCLRGMTKNPSILHLWPFLWAIAQCFGLLGGFTWPMTLSTYLRDDQKLIVFVF